MFKINVIIFILLCSTPILSLCQQAPDIIKNYAPAAPNAASLGKYADFPVSYHTGIPNINVPLSTVNQGAISVDL